MIWSGKWKRIHRDIPNAVSLLRALIGISIPFFLLHDQPSFHWIAFYLFLLGSFTDFIDGFIARSFSWESSFGKIVDPTADKILVLAPLATFAYLDLYSVWWIVPIFVREIAVTFCRIAWCLDGSVVGAEKIGKLKFGFQVAALVSAFLFYLSFHYRDLQAYQTLIGQVMKGTLGISILLTTISGISFFANNLKNLKTPSFIKFTAATGVGLLPWAPGTWGSLLGVGIAALASFHPVVYGVCFLSFLWLGYWSVSRLDLTKNSDPGFVVIDEVLGMMLSLFLIPMDMLGVLVGFLLFRGFDICKPFPLNKLERLPGYWGILMDDLGAGVYTWILLVILHFIGTFS